MKRLIIIITCSIISVVTYSQSMLNQGNAWTYLILGTRVVVSDDNPYYMEFTECEYVFTKYYIKGTREINGKTYHEIWETRQKYNGPVGYRTEDFEIVFDCYAVALREDDGRIYADKGDYLQAARNHYYYYNENSELFPEIDGEYLLYDFKAKPSESIIPYVGNIYSLLLPINNFVSNASLVEDGIYRNQKINLFYRNGQLEYISSRFRPDPFFPDVVADGIELMPSYPDIDSIIYNLQGQRIARPQRGINIVGGRKVLIL